MRRPPKLLKAWNIEFSSNSEKVCFSELYLSEQLKNTITAKRDEEMKKKKERAEQARIQREIEMSEKAAAEEAKRRIDSEKQRERLGKGYNVRLKLVDIFVEYYSKK